MVRCCIVTVQRVKCCCLVAMSCSLIRTSRLVRQHLRPIGPDRIPIWILVIPILRVHISSRAMVMLPESEAACPRFWNKCNVVGDQDKSRWYSSLRCRPVRMISMQMDSMHRRRGNKVNSMGFRLLRELRLIALTKCSVN